VWLASYTAQALDLKAPLIPFRRWMKKENPTDGVNFTKRLDPARLTFG
jgi:hypothetical protein